MATAQPTTNHDEIRSWVEARNGRPARVKATGEGSDPGILRIDFPGFSGEDTLEEIEWDEFFDWFDRNGLALLLSDEEGNRFNKIVSRETAAASSSSSTKKRATARKRGTSKASTKSANTKPASKKATFTKRGGSTKKANAKKATTKKASTKKASTKKASTKKATTKKASAKSPARSASTKRSTAARKPSGRSTTSRTTTKKASSAGTSSAKKISTKKSTATKSSTKRSATKKSATKKSTAKKSTAKSRAVSAVRSMVGGSRKGSGKSSSRQGSKASSRRGSGSSVTTTDRNEIRRWVEARGGFPAHVRKTGGRKGDLGVLRIDYPGYSGRDTLERVDWDSWFRAFDKNKLAFLYQDKKNSRFSKLVAR